MELLQNEIWYHDVCVCVAVKAVICRITHAPTPSFRRMPRVSPESVDFVTDRITKWQQSNNKKCNDRPCETIWYNDLRVEMIQKSLIHKDYSWDICRNIARDWVCKQPNVPRVPGGIKDAN
jgi:hypothetical protein